MDTRTNRIIGAAAAAALALGTAAVASPASASDALAETEPGAPAQACQIRKLPVPEGTVSSYVSAGDPSGRLILGQAQFADGYHEVIWEDRVPRLLDLPSGEAELTSVSRNGTIGGYLWTGPIHGGFVITPDGEFHKVTEPDGGTTTVAGVTNDGAAAGDVYREGPGALPSAWAPGAYDEPVYRGTPRDRPVNVVGVNPDGSILAATIGLDELPYRTYVWTADGERTALDGTARGLWTTGAAISSRWAVGREVDVETGKTRIVRWRLPSGRASAVPGPGPWADMAVGAVNRHGVIGGSVWDGPPVLIVGDDLVELPVLDGSGGAGVAAVASNGDAAGYAYDEGESTAVTWRCG